MGKEELGHKSQIAVSRVCSLSEVGEKIIGLVRIREDQSEYAYEGGSLNNHL